MTGGGDCRDGHWTDTTYHVCELPLGHGGHHRNRHISWDQVAPYAVSEGQPTETTETQPVEMVHHPQHYGGKDDPFEHHKVVYGWGLDYYLGNCTKYIRRAGRKPGADTIEDLEKAKWYLEQEIALLRREQEEGERG